jgi:hypothetical protein
VDNYAPVVGKTYTLFGEDKSTHQYYSIVRNLTNQLLDRFLWSEQDLLNYLQKISRNRHSLNKEFRQNPAKSRPGEILNLLNAALSSYTPGVEKHLKSEPYYKFITDKSILTNRYQYYLYMIEIELINRLNKNNFLGCGYKIALLPYCLRETQTECKSAADEIDYYCRKCLQNCYINKVSTLLRENNIQPYIWRTVRLKSLLGHLVKKHGNVGIMGIACIVELARGMRSCLKAGLPVIGLPLNANRCIRWMGDFYDNSVDLEELKFLLY